MHSVVGSEADSAPKYYRELTAAGRWALGIGDLTMWVAGSASPVHYCPHLAPRSPIPPSEERLMSLLSLSESEGPIWGQSGRASS